MVMRLRSLWHAVRCRLGLVKPVQGGTVVEEDELELDTGPDYQEYET